MVGAKGTHMIRKVDWVCVHVLFFLVALIIMRTILNLVTAFNA